LHDGTVRDVFPRVSLEDGVGIVRSQSDEVRIEDPELWWPNGMGEQRLHRVHLEGRDFDVGFRAVELRDYMLVVNGEPIPIKGWNWVPLDALYGVARPEKLARLLGLAARANVNLLRVWGGGLIETEEFYDLCDRLGLLVWQEFSQSSFGMESIPASDDEFLRLMTADARQIVPRLRRHPSLAVWCGGNELAADDSHPVLGALRAVVCELDPERAWLPTSPLGDADVHGPWEHQGLRRQSELYDNATAKLYSEFGVEGMTNRAALEELVDEEHRWPADRTNPIYEHLGAWWNNAPLVQECFGDRIGDVATMRRASQWLQYDGLRYAVEATLRRSCGTIPWQFNESFPNAWCTAAVDYHGVPKPAYWGVARAYRADHVSAKFATCAWGAEPEVRAHIHGDCVARVVDLHGTVVAEGRGEIVAPLDAIETDVFLLDLEGRNRYVMTRTENLAPLLDLPAAQLRTTRNGNRLELRNGGDVAAIGVVVEGAVSDNVLDLLPGESRVLEVEGEHVVGGWNV
jgi:beta-mannosidase